MIVAAPTYQRLVAEFEGQEAHAGLQPEAGRNAIAAAAAAIAEMKLGRIDDETTANVGVIEGGTATNVVAGRCRVEGEARSVDPDKASATIAAMVETCSWAAGERKCDSTSTWSSTSARTGSRRALRASPSRGRRWSGGARGREIATGGGSDANALIAAGFDAVLLANGTERNHTPEESIAAASIVEMLERLRGDRSTRAPHDDETAPRRGSSRRAASVEVDGSERPAWADAGLVGEVEAGDEVVVNTEALDLELGSGGFDVVCANLTRGLDAPGGDGAT